MVFNSQKSNFQIYGLIFECEEDYLIFKNLDKNINETVKLVNDGILDIEDVFKDIKKIKVKECYYNAEDELDRLFLNATSLLVSEHERFIKDYQVGIKFFEKIDVIEYDD